jgi:hypothetical protein
MYGEIIQGDQKVSVHLMITVLKHAKYFKQFQSLTIITYLELGITGVVSDSLVNPLAMETGGGHFELYLQRSVL